MRPSLVLAFLLAGPASAQAPSLQGDWLGIDFTASLGGLFVPGFEHLHVDGDRVVERAWNLAAHDGCGPDFPYDLISCTLPVSLGESRLTTGAHWIEVAPNEPQANPFVHLIERAAWPDVALAGHRWRVSVADRHMFMMRPGRIGEMETTFIRLYYRAPARAAGDLFLYLRNIGVQNAHAICGVVALNEDPVQWDAFFAYLEGMAEVMEEIERIDRMPREVRTREEWFRRLTLMSDPELLGDRVVDVSDLSETGRAALLALRLGLDARRQDETLLRTLLWPASAAIREIETRCLDQFGF